MPIKTTAAIAPRISPRRAQADGPTEILGIRGKETDGKRLGPDSFGRRPTAKSMLIKFPTLS
jgi:hypothetical protein